MRATSVLATVLAAVGLQTILARYTVAGRWQFDLVLVAVVYAALSWGPAAGMLGGTAGGLLQDMLSGGIVGVGGLAKTLVGFAAGTIGAQFIVTRPRERALVVAGATVAHRLIILTVYALVDQNWSGVRWIAMLEETALNALCGFLAFHATEALPDLMSRGRMSRRSKWSQRRW